VKKGQGRKGRGGVGAMAWWSCFGCGPSIAAEGEVRLPEPFQLPAPLPDWPQGSGTSSLSSFLPVLFNWFLILICVVIYGLDCRIVSLWMDVNFQLLCVSSRQI
jgi:hypothetical protein